MDGKGPECVKTQGILQLELALFAGGGPVVLAPAES